MKIDLELVVAGLILLLILAMAAIQVTITVTGWKASGHYASTHDDPSPGPNSLF